MCLSVIQPELANCLNLTEAGRQVLGRRLLPAMFASEGYNETSIPQGVVAVWVRDAMQVRMLSSCRPQEEMAADLTGAPSRLLRTTRGLL